MKTRSPPAYIIEALAPIGLPELPVTSPGREQRSRRMPRVDEVVQSSGSTDLPKGVIITQRMMCSNQAAVAQVWCWCDRIAAARLWDEDGAQRWKEFNGRIAEDFKLSSRTWVNVDALRVQAIAAGAPVIQDAVVTGHDRTEIGLLVFPSEEGCRALCPDAPSTMLLGELIHEPRVRRRIKNALTAMAADSSGSSTCPVRVLLMSEPPSLDAGEITDKGYVNQRTVLERRLDLVERLHAAMPDPEVIVAPREAGRIAA